LGLVAALGISVLVFPLALRTRSLGPFFLADFFAIIFKQWFTITAGSAIYPGWRVLNVSGNSNNEALCGPWNFNANNSPGNANTNNGSLLSHFLSKKSRNHVFL